MSWTLVLTNSTWTPAASARRRPWSMNLSEMSNPTQRPAPAFLQLMSSRPLLQLSCATVLPESLIVSKIFRSTESKVLKSGALMRSKRSATYPRSWTSAVSFHMTRLASIRVSSIEANRNRLGLQHVRRLSAFHAS